MKNRLNLISRNSKLYNIKQNKKKIKLKLFLKRNHKNNIKKKE